MTDCSVSSIKSIPLKERELRLAAVYRLILSLPNPNEEGDCQGVDIVVNTRFEEGRDRNLLVRNVIHTNMIVGQSAADDKD